jgi:hypothetical protein
MAQALAGVFSVTSKLLSFSTSEYSSASLQPRVSSQNSVGTNDRFADGKRIAPKAQRIVQQAQGHSWFQFTLNPVSSFPRV